MHKIKLVSVCVCVCVLQEALRYYNQTTMQLQMLEFSRRSLVSDDEVSTKRHLRCLSKLEPHAMTSPGTRFVVWLTQALSLYDLWSHDNLQHNVGPVFIRLQYDRWPRGGSITQAFVKLIQCSTRTEASRTTQHNPGLHALCSKYHSALDCNLLSNARYEKSQILCGG